MLWLDDSRTTSDTSHQILLLPDHNHARYVKKNNNNNTHTVSVCLELLKSEGTIQGNIVKDMTLIMTSAQVVETSVNVTNNSPSRDYSHPDDQTTQTIVKDGASNLVKVIKGKPQAYRSR